MVCVVGKRQLHPVDVAQDSKTRVLVEHLNEILESEPNAKVIIFTQFLETQAYIAEHVPPTWSAHIFNGGLKPADKDRAVARFRDDDGPQLLISSEAGGEGRNLQFSTSQSRARRSSRYKFGLDFPAIPPGRTEGARWTH